MQEFKGAVLFNKAVSINGGLSIDGNVKGDAKFDSGTVDIQDGGSVTQDTNRTNGVTLNKLTGQVEGDDTSLGAVTIATHTVTNSTVGANDVVIISKVSGDPDTSCWVDAVTNGSFNVAIRNNHASGADTTAFIYNFVVIKGSNS